MNATDLQPANDWITFGSGNVLMDLDLVMTREEWAKSCERHGSTLPYPYAEVIQFPPLTEAGRENRK